MSDTTERYTERGFRIYAEIADRYGSSVTVQKSSLASEDCVWLFATNRAIRDAAPHLNVMQARVIRDALDEFINEHSQEDDRG